MLNKDEDAVVVSSDVDSGDKNISALTELDQPVISESEPSLGLTADALSSTAANAPVEDSAFEQAWGKAVEEKPSGAENGN